MKTLLLSLTTALSVFSATSVSADAPERFPAVSEATIQDRVRNVRCVRNDQSSIARQVGQHGRYRGYGLRICNAEHEAAGLAVLWVNTSVRGGPERMIPTLPNGRRLPRPNDGGYQNDGGQQAQWAVFAYPISRQQFLSCGAAMFNRRTEPFAGTFCDGPFNIPRN